MMKITVALLFAVLPISPATAGTIAGGGGNGAIDGPAAKPMSPWTAPLTKTFIQIGTDRISALGAPPLSRMADAVAESKTMWYVDGKKGSSAIFDRLSVQLAAKGMSPEQFV